MNSVKFKNINENFLQIADKLNYEYDKSVDLITNIDKMVNQINKNIVEKKDTISTLELKFKLKKEEYEKLLIEKDNIKDEKSEKLTTKLNDVVEANQEKDKLIILLKQEIEKINMSIIKNKNIDEEHNKAILKIMETQAKTKDLKQEIIYLEEIRIVLLEKCNDMEKMDDELKKNLSGFTKEIHNKNEMIKALELELLDIKITKEIAVEHEPNRELQYMIHKYKIKKSKYIQIKKNFVKRGNKKSSKAREIFWVYSK